MKPHGRPDSRSFDEASAAYRSAEFSRAHSLLERLLSAEQDAGAALLLARADLKRGNPSQALTDLTKYARCLKARPAQAEAALVKGIAFARLGDPKSAKAQFGSARDLLKTGDALYAELLYQEAAASWIERKLDAAQKTLDKLGSNLPADVAIQAKILRGAIASAQEDLPAQGAILLQAVQTTDPSSVNVQLYAALVTQVAALTVELSSASLRDAAREKASAVRWTDDIADLHFHTMRALAWRYALEGDEFNAFRRLKDAANATNSLPWRVAALTDRAYLADALGERRWAAQELRDAHDLALTVNWASVEGEEKLALPVLAELFASRDPAVAVHYLTTFQKVGHDYPRTLSSNNDRRVRALEAYSLGKVQAALGDNAEAERLLKEAWKIYSDLGISWRAARAALALQEIGGDKIWGRRAADDLADYPRSWLARRSGGATPAAAIASSPALERLTPAQRTVFDLLVQGRSTKQIATSLERSDYTVKNHIKAIFKVFGVSSRAALIVRASQG